MLEMTGLMSRVGILLFWSCIVFFFMAFSRAVVNGNDSSGTALTLWCGLQMPNLKGLGSAGGA